MQGANAKDGLHVDVMWMMFYKSIYKTDGYAKTKDRLGGLFHIERYNYSFGVAFSTRLFNFWPGRKVTTRRAVIGISSPVFGLRPGR